ncbi:MAG: TIM23 complex component [Sarcosagium campestre]|nr:MAG: TIM23 complex component [Sarcosagium campestre]
MELVSCSIGKSQYYFQLGSRATRSSHRDDLDYILQAPQSPPKIQLGGIIDIVELLGPQIGDLNPFIILGLITAGFTTVGWLSGPMFGSAIFRTFNKNTAAEIISKEREFYRRIKKYRVDPSSQSIANPVPDYYGEKISSVGGYRQWLKDQRAFNIKRQSF